MNDCVRGGIIHLTFLMAWWWTDLYLSFVYRVSMVVLQVKIRGYRVELSEIESVMCEHPGVKSAVVDVQVRGPDSPLILENVPQSEFSRS